MRNPLLWTFKPRNAWHEAEDQVLIHYWRRLKILWEAPTVIQSLRNWQGPQKEVVSQGPGTDLLLFLPEESLQQFNLRFCSGQIPRGLRCLSAEPLCLLQVLLGRRRGEGPTVLRAALFSLSLPDSVSALISSHAWLPPTQEVPGPTLPTHHLAAPQPSVGSSGQGTTSEKQWSVSLPDPQSPTTAGALWTALVRLSPPMTCALNCISICILQRLWQTYFSQDS